MLETEYVKVDRDLKSDANLPFPVFITLRLQLTIVFDSLPIWLLFCVQYDATHMTILVTDRQTV